MADPLDFKATGTEKNLKMQEAYLDVTKNIYDISKKQADLSKKSSQFSRAELAALKAKHKEMETMAKDIQKDLMYRSQSESDRKRIVLQTEDAQRRIDDKSLKQRIARNQLLYKQMKMEADFLEQKAAERIESENRWWNLAKKIGNENLKINIAEYNTAKGIATELEKFPKLTGVWGKALAIVLTVLISAYDLFTKLDKAAWEFRQAMGLTRGDMTSMRSSIEASAISMMNLGVTINDLYNATKAVGAEMGGIHNISASIRDNISVMKAQLGVSEEISAKFLRNMAAIGGKSIISQENTTYMAQSLSSAAGTNLSEIMGDIANASGITLSLMNRMPNQMLRAAIEARRFNTNINDIARANRTVLDFTTSIQDEMEASVLLGHAINLQRLRELSFAGDIEGSMKERIRLAEKEDFLNIKNVFQKEAIAKALGTSVESLTKQLQANQEIERIRKSGTQKEKEQLAIYEKRLAAKEKEASAEALRVRNEIMSVGNQYRIAQISQKWSKIMAKLGEVFLPVIDKVLGFILNHLEVVMGTGATLWVLGGKIMATFKEWGPMILRSGGAIKGLTGMVGGLVRVVGRFVLPLMFAWNMFKRIRDILNDKEFMNMESTGKFIGLSILKGFGVVLGGLWETFNDFLFGAPNLIIDAFFVQPFKLWLLNVENQWREFKYSWKNGWSELMKIYDAIGEAIYNGLVAVRDNIWDVLTDPFRRAWDWFNKTIMGASPSELGMGIVRGIMGVGPMILAALTDPFITFFKWISTKLSNIPGMGKIFGPTIESKMVGSYIPAATITPKGTTVTGAERKGTTPAITGAERKGTTPAIAETTSMWDELLVEIKGQRAATEELVSLLKSGKIQAGGTYLDGALISTLLARNLDFRGNFGVNK